MASVLRSNRDWSDCDDAFREEADRAIAVLMEGEQEYGRWLATRLVHRYPVSPLAHTILAHASPKGAWDLARIHLEHAAKLAPRCPHIAMELIDVLVSVKSFDKAAEVRDRALRVQDPTDPALHYTALSNDVSGHINSSVLEHRIAGRRTIIRWLRGKIEKGKGAVVPPEPVFALNWPPRIVDLERACARWSSMSNEERQALLKVSFGDMKLYCRSLGLSGQCEHRMISMLSDAEVFVNKGCSSYWFCPFCTPYTTRYKDVMDFKMHIDEKHIKEDKELRSFYVDVKDFTRLTDEDHIRKDKELLSLVPKRVSDSEKELLKLWRWEPSDGDDLTERTRILSMVKEVVFELIDLEVISLNLLYIIHKFVMKRVRPVVPLVVSICGSCGIGQLSSTHLQDLYDFLEPLTRTHSGCKHQKPHNGEQESLQDLLGAITWSQETCTLSFDCEKIASRETDGSSEEDGLFAYLLSEPLFDPKELCFGMWGRCFDDEILNKISQALDKLKLKCSSWEELKGIQGGVYFLPKAIFERDIDITTYFHSRIGSAQVEMLLIDAEVDYWKERLLKTCQVDYLAVISPIAKACLWAKLVNNPPEDVLLAHPQNDHEPQFPLDVILRSLWHIWRFHDDLQKIRCPRICPDVIAGVYCIILLRIFCSWDHAKERKTSGLLSSAKFMVDSLRSFVIDEKAGAGSITAYRVVESILERLHMAQTPLHFEFKGESLGPHTAIVPSFLGCICQAHTLFGLHIEKKCNCVNVVPTKTESTFFHSINLGAVEGTKLESFSELLKAVDRQLLCNPKNGGCGSRIAQYLSYPPHLFMIVFRWQNNKGSHINMHEVLISLAEELDISHIYEGLHSESTYTLVSAVCCDDEGQYLCFARDKAWWLIYDSKTVKYAESWQVLIGQYSQANLRPEILCFEHAKKRGPRLLL